MTELNTTSIEGSLTVSETASIGGDLTANGGNTWSFYRVFRNLKRCVFNF